MPQKKSKSAGGWDCAEEVKKKNALLRELKANPNPVS
jgi:hypothetical protein